MLRYVLFFTGFGLMVVAILYDTNVDAKDFPAIAIPIFGLACITVSFFWTGLKTWFIDRTSD